jgi:tetratricopeptide (TPR) repeat protein
VPNHVTLEGPTLTVSVRPLATLDAEEWLVRQLATAALAVHWRQDGAQDKLQVYPRAMTYEDQLIAIEDVADVDLAQALAAAIALPAEGHEQAAQRSLMLGSFTARDGDLEAALTHLEAAAASARGAGLPVLEAEAQVTRASVHAALGDYDAALPMLRAEVERLQGIAGTEDLLRDARAELEAYETLLGV